MDYLVQHGKKGTWKYRRRLPTDLQKHFGGRKEFVKSTKTSDYQAALQQAVQITDHLERLFKAYRLKDLKGTSILEQQRMVQEWLDANLPGFLEMTDQDGEQVSRGMALSALRSELVDLEQDKPSSPLVARSSYREPLVARSPDREPLFNQKLDAIDNGGGAMPPTTLAAALELYLAQKAETQRPEVHAKLAAATTNAVQRFTAFNKGKDNLKEITRQNVRNWIAILKKTKARYSKDRTLSAAAVTKLVKSAGTVFGFGMTEFNLGHTLSNPFSKQVLPKADTAGHRAKLAFTEDEYLAFQKRSTERSEELSILVRLLATTGMRIGEGAGLEKGDLLLDKKAIHVRPNATRGLKTVSSERLIPIVDEDVWAYLRALAESDSSLPSEPLIGRNTDKIFPTYTGNLSRSRMHMTAALAAAGVEDKPPSALRHLFVDRMRAAGIDETSTEALLGHGAGSIARRHGSEAWLGLFREALERAVLGGT